MMNSGALYIYIYRERERERDGSYILSICSDVVEAAQTPCREKIQKTNRKSGQI
jgi:hypothetical protein